MYRIYSNQLADRANNKDTRSQLREDVSRENFKWLRNKKKKRNSTQQQNNNEFQTMQ